MSSRVKLSIAKAPARARELSITPLHRVLLSRGLRFEDLASLTGLNIRTVYNIACGGNKSKRGRTKVEIALGATINWCKPRSLETHETEGEA